MKPIYLDYAATTPVDPSVAKAMQQCLTIEGDFGNPSSNHFYGYGANELVQQSQQQLASLFGVQPREIIFTSGATESNNLALKGVAESYGHQGRHIITSAIEHKAILDTTAYLEKKGFEVTYLKPDADGYHSPEQVKAALTDQTIMVSIMTVNNELGTIQPIEAIGRICREHKVLFHTDAAQAAGKIPIDIKQSHIDLLSLSAHKMYGPKGIGMLYVRRRPKIKLTPLIHGGGHQQGYRSGTLPVHQIVGLGKAAQIAESLMDQHYQHLTALRDRLVDGLSQLSHIRVNTNLKRSFPGIVNIAFEGIDGEALLMALHQLAVSSGSACTSAVYQSSHVLRGIGLTDQLADQSLRISLGKYTTEENVDQAVDQIVHHVKRLRKLSPNHKQFEL